jgi:hypothetical protein
MSELESKYYKGQALAITMVVLVVSALIGLSIYSRSMRDRMLTLEERASAEALEVSDATLENLMLIPIEEVVTAMEMEEGETIEFTESEDTHELTDLFRDLGIIEETNFIDELFSPICPPGESANQYKLTLKEADENTFYEVRAGHVWSLPARDVLKNKSDCVLGMNFAIRGDSRAGFVVSKIYCEYEGDDGLATNCEEYEIGDFDKYCFSDDGVSCNNPNFDDDGESNWEKINPDIGETIGAINMSGPGEVPSEIRITAIAGTVGINYSIPTEACMDGLRMYQVKATANCNGVFRGKEILIPEEKWHESIFDYVIFNNKGSL